MKSATRATFVVIVATIGSLALGLAAPGLAFADDDKDKAARERERAERDRERVERERERMEEERDRMEEEREAMQECAQDPECRKHLARGGHGRYGHGKGGGGGAAGLPTTVKVKTPVRFTVEVVTADVEIVAAGNDTVSVAAKNCGPDELGLDVDGDEIEAVFDEWGSCQGPVTIKVPVGSSVEVASVEGDLRLKGSYKEVEAATVAGGVEIDAAEIVEVEAVQGNIKVGKARRADIESVAGNVELTTEGAAPLVDVETVSGGVRWSGTCGKGCRIAVESFQGTVKLGFEPKASSFEVKFATHGGKLVDKLGLKTVSSGKNVKGYSPSKSTYGKGEGAVRVETYQSDLEVTKK